MAKHEKHHQSEPRAQVRVPKGHFNSDGMSEGKQSGAVRKTPDANCEHYNRQEEHHDAKK